MKKDIVFPVVSATIMVGGAASWLNMELRKPDDNDFLKKKKIAAGIFFLGLFGLVVSLSSSPVNKTT